MSLPINNTGVLHKMRLVMLARGRCWSHSLFTFQPEVRPCFTSPRSRRVLPCLLSERTTGFRCGGAFVLGGNIPPPRAGWGTTPTRGRPFFFFNQTLRFFLVPPARPPGLPPPPKKP